MCKLNAYFSLTCISDFTTVQCTHHYKWQIKIIIWAFVKTLHKFKSQFLFRFVKMDYNIQKKSTANAKTEFSINKSATYNFQSPRY